MKFKLGDHVVGNDKARIYCLTGPGWRGVVVGVNFRIGTIVVRGLEASAGGREYEVVPQCFDLIPKSDNLKKIVVTSDGVTTTARLYDGKSILRSAEARCSPKDTFNFETGAALAVDRLLGRGAKETESSVATAKPFSLTYLSSGRFGYTNRDKWFVVVDDRLVYVENGTGWDDIADLNADGVFRSGHRIEFVVDAYSLGIAKYRDRTGNYIWKRNK